MDKNWRGLPVHTVDEWDTWKVSRQEYEEMKQIWEELVGTSPVDIEPHVRKMMEFAVRQSRHDHDDYNSGEDI